MKLWFRSWSGSIRISSFSKTKKIFFLRDPFLVLRPDKHRGRDLVSVYRRNVSNCSHYSIKRTVYLFYIFHLKVSAKQRLSQLGLYCLSPSLSFSLTHTLVLLFCEHFIRLSAFSPPSYKQMILIQNKSLNSKFQSAKSPQKDGVQFFPPQRMSPHLVWGKCQLISAPSSAEAP